MKMYCSFPFYHEDEQRELTAKFFVNVAPRSAARTAETKAMEVKELVMGCSDHFVKSRKSDTVLYFTNTLPESENAGEYMAVTVSNDFVRGVALIFDSHFKNQTDTITINYTKRKAA